MIPIFGNEVRGETTSDNSCKLQLNLERHSEPDMSQKNTFGRGSGGQALSVAAPRSGRREQNRDSLKAIDNWRILCYTNSVGSAKAGLRISALSLIRLTLSSAASFLARHDRHRQSGRTAGIVEISQSAFRGGLDRFGL